jgi:hypothetical protein
MHEAYKWGHETLELRNNYLRNKKTLIVRSSTYEYQCSQRDRLNTHTKVNKNFDLPQVSINPKLAAVFCSNSDVTVGWAI